MAVVVVKGAWVPLRLPGDVCGDVLLMTDGIWLMDFVLRNKRNGKMVKRRRKGTGRE